jgi:hypothetical protein
MPPLRALADVERKPHKGYGTGVVEKHLESLVDDVGLVDDLADASRFALRRILGAHPNDSYPGYVYRQLAFYSSYVIKTWGRRAFSLDTRPLKVCISDTVDDMAGPAGTAHFTKRPVRTRASVWCAAVPGVRPMRSGEVVCAAQVRVQTAAGPGAPPSPLLYYDVLLVQWHAPLRGFLEDPVIAMKPSRVLDPPAADTPATETFSERPAVVAPRVETPEEAAAAEFQYVTRHGSLALAGGPTRIPADAYHAHIPADVVSLSTEYDFVPPGAVIGRADVVHAFVAGLYNTNATLLPNVRFPPLFRMFPRV